MKPKRKLQRGLKTTEGLRTKNTIIPVAEKILRWVSEHHVRAGVCKGRMYNDLMSEAIKARDGRFGGLE